MARVSKNKKFDREIERILTERINGAAQIARNNVVKLINRTQPTDLTRGGRLIGLAPSLPGEPPKRLTGALVRSITAGVAKVGNKIRGYVGTNRVGARRLEYGFQGVDSAGRSINQAPRPYLRRGVMEARAAMLRILRRGA